MDIRERASGESSHHSNAKLVVACRENSECLLE
jgi:hypothetical protein